MNQGIEAPRITHNLSLFERRTWYQLVQALSRFYLLAFWEPLAQRLGTILRVASPRKKPTIKPPTLGPFRDTPTSARGSPGLWAQGGQGCPGNELPSSHPSL